VPMTGCCSFIQLAVAGSKRSAVPSGSPMGRSSSCSGSVPARHRPWGSRPTSVAQHHLDLGRRIAGPHGMPLSATEILASAGTGLNSSAVGTGGRRIDLAAAVSAGRRDDLAGRRRLVGSGRRRARVGHTRRAHGEGNRCRDGCLCDQSAPYTFGSAEIWPWPVPCLVNYARKDAISVRGTSTVSGPF
jgi:hypothetical protein